MSNPYGRRGKIGFVISTLSIPAFGCVLCYFGQVAWGIALIISGTIMFILSIWIAYGRK